MDTLEFHSAVTVQFNAKISPCNVWSKLVLFKYTSRILFTAKRRKTVHSLKIKI